MAKLLVFNSMTSASASLMRTEISTTTNSISYKPILTSRQLYTMTMTSKAAATTEEMTTTKATATTTMDIINQQKRKKRLGVAGKVTLIVICKK